MIGATALRRTRLDFLTAVQFLTRMPLPGLAYEKGSLARAVKFFPVVGALVGSTAAFFHMLLAPHLPRLIAALLVVIFLVLLTGCLHEDGLADAADGFGGGWDREQVLVILKDSRIGSYGATALMLSLMTRVFLLSCLQLDRIAAVLIAAHVLCRWTTLPLSYFLDPASNDTETSSGQGARIARVTTPTTLIVGTLFSFATVGLLLRARALPAIVGAVLISLLSGIYYRRRIGGVTGDCFGATNQIAEIAVYLTGVWIL